MFTRKNIKILIAILIAINLAVFAYFMFFNAKPDVSTSKIIPNMEQLVLLNERNFMVKEQSFNQTELLLANEVILEAPKAPEPTPVKDNKKETVDSPIEDDGLIDETENTLIETEIEPEPIIDVAETTAETIIDNTLCYTIGPFENKADKIHSQNQLNNLSISSSVRIILEKEISSYYLYIPPHKTLKAAQNTIEKLKNKKVRDFYLLRKGDRTNAIALGLFSQEKHALRKFDLLQKLYFKVKMEVRYIDKEVYWLDYQGKESVLNLIDLKEISPLPLQLYLRPCR